MLSGFNRRIFFITLLLIMSFLVAGYMGALLLSIPPIPTTVTPPPTTQPPEETVNFLIVGDIMLSRNVARHAEKSGKTKWIWEHINSFLHSVDFVVGNLEGPTNGTSVYSYEKVMTFNALPHLIRELSDVNFAALNLANNHIMDQGLEGLPTTQKLLSNIGIIGFGAGQNSGDAWQPKIIERNGIRIAFIGASYAAYNDNGSGVNERVARMQDTKNMQLSIQRAQGIADFIVVMMHAGAEYTREPTKLQKDFSRNAIDAGADIVLGAHPHWTQGVEPYKGKYILYSLGNFVFDQEFSTETKTGLAVEISLSKQSGVTKLTQTILHPILIENYGQPRLLVGEEKIKALQEIHQEGDILK